MHKDGGREVFLKMFAEPKVLEKQNLVILQEKQLEIILKSQMMKVNDPESINVIFQYFAVRHHRR